MNKVFLSILFMFSSVHFAFASMQNFTDIRHEEIILSEGNGSEIITVHEGSSGTAQYEKVMRIFVDEGSQLSEVFFTYLSEEHYYSGIYPNEHVAFISAVELGDMNEKGTRDITVKVKKYTFKDDRENENNSLKDDERFMFDGEIIQEEDLGTMIYRWDEDQYVLLGGQTPEKIAQKIEYENSIYDNIERKGTNIGDKTFW